MKLGYRLRTLGAIAGHFASGQRWFLMPMLVVLMLAGLLLVATSGLAYVAPFAYSIF